MKPKFILSVSLTPLALWSSLAASAAANTDLFWDADADTSVATGGTGIWNSSSPLWRPTTSTGTPIQSYDNTAPSTITAQISGTAGVLTIASGTTINVNKVAIGTTGYTIAGANGTTAILNLSGAAPEIVGTGTTVFTNKITGTSGFTLSGGNFNVFAGDLSGLSGTVNVTSRATLQGIIFGAGNGAFALSGSQFQEWNVSNTLTSNNHGSGTTIQLGALSGPSTGLVRSGNDGTAPAAAGDDIFQVGALNTNTVYAGAVQDQSAANITGLTKVGSGTLTLSGTSNSYTGGTLVSAGILNVTGSLTGATSGISTNGTGIATNGTGILTLGSTGVISGAKTFTQGSSGTSTLAGTITHTGATTVSAGALTITGTSGAGTIGALNLTGASGTLNIASTGTLKATSLSAGTAATDAGVVNQSAGTLTLSGDIALGNSGGYGAYTMTGGTLNVVSMRTGSIAGGGNGSGYILQTGGTINVSSITTLNRNGTGTSVLNIAGPTAVYSQTAGNLNPGFAAGGTGIVNVSAGLLAVTNDISLRNGNSNSIVNLNGGTVQTRSIVATGGTSGDAVINFNGGVLKANADNGAFLTGLTKAVIYSGGASIDTNGKSVTIGQALLASGGTTGVGNIAITGGGSGYLAAPVVSLSGGGGGTGASAVATVVGGVVTGIQITSTGTGYTSAPTVTLVGGGATTAATVGSVVNGANAADGGLTKTGAGTLTLSGANTYTGGTKITTGTLALGATGSINNSSTIIVGANTTFNVSAVTGGYTLAAGQTLSGTGTLVGAAGIAGTLSPGNSPGTLAVGNQTWLNGGDYNWQVQNAQGVAGADYDTISMTGTLDLSSLTASGFNINLWSLASVAPDVSGNAVNFDNTADQSWTLLTASGGITGFTGSEFAVNTSAINGTGGFGNALGGGVFSMGQSGNNLVLNFTAVPEPSTVFLLSGLGLVLLRRRRSEA